MDDRSPESQNSPAPPLVLEYARPLPARLPLPGRTPKFTIVFGFLVSGTLIFVGVLLLIVAAMLWWSSMEVARGDSSGMQLGGCYALVAGAVFLIVGMAGRRMALRQWRSR